MAVSEMCSVVGKEATARDFVRIVFKQQLYICSYICGDMRSVIAPKILSRFAFMFMNSSFLR